MFAMSPDVELYYRMLLIRRFEERVVALVNTNEIAGITHEYVGQEAVAVGVCTTLQKEDIITSTHRGHGHLIAKRDLLGREAQVHGVSLWSPVMAGPVPAIHVLLA